MAHEDTCHLYILRSIMFSILSEILTWLSLGRQNYVGLARMSTGLVWGPPHRKNRPRKWWISFSNRPRNRRTGEGKGARWNGVEERARLSPLARPLHDLLLVLSACDANAAASGTGSQLAKLHEYRAILSIDWWIKSINAVAKRTHAC